MCGTGPHPARRHPRYPEDTRRWDARESGGEQAIPGSGRLWEWTSFSEDDPILRLGNLTSQLHRTALRATAASALVQQVDELLLNGFGGGIVGSDDEDRVVPRNGADDLGPVFH